MDEPGGITAGLVQSVTETQVLSHYLVTSQHELMGNPESLAEGLAFPLTDTYMARRFGLRTMRSALNLVGGDVKRKNDADEDYTGEVAGDVRDARNRLFNWHRLNPFFEQGQLVVAGRDRYRVGDPVRLPWRRAPFSGDLGMRYYLTGVTWGWSYGQPYQCTLALERGHTSAMVAEITRRIRADAPAASPDHFAES